jgi:hypothetical protein
MSSVGNRAVYEADGQYTALDFEKKMVERFEERTRHSHQLTIQVRIHLPKCTILRIATETRPVLDFPDKVKNSGKT